jgi:hypothetical protein
MSIKWGPYRNYHLEEMCTMILISLNVRGLGNIQKEMALHRLVKVHKVEDLLLQETIG